MSLVLSIFPGIGLLDHAFDLEGFTVVRGPDVIWGGAIRRFHPPARKFDGIIGGPPCQSFSPLVNLVRANGHEPKFGNLIPEFERCVREAQPAWFLMENVPQAPEPVVDGYGVKSFLLDNSMLADLDGKGQEQIRKRRFSFGMRDSTEVPDLRRWIDLATFLLPDAERTVTSNVGGFTDGSPNPNKTKHETVTGGASVRMSRYRIPDALRLQGLPADFLDHCPFTAEGKLKAIANGVPIPMGRAIAKSVREAMQVS